MSEMGLETSRDSSGYPSVCVTGGRVTGVTSQNCFNAVPLIMSRIIELVGERKDTLFTKMVALLSVPVALLLTPLGLAALARRQ